MIDIEEINLENAANTPIIKDLRRLLNSLTVKDLRNIGDLFVINRLSNKVKSDLVKVIYNTLTNENELSQVVERFIDKEFNLLKKLLDNNGIIQDNNINMEEYHFLYMIGIVFLFRRNNKFYISMTNDVYNEFKKIDLNKFNKVIEDNTKVYNLIRAMVELYGVVSYGDLVDSFNLYYSEVDYMDLSDDALYFCDRLDNISRFYAENNLYFISEILNNDRFETIFDDVEKRQYEIRRKQMKLSELLKYIDYNYYEDNLSRKKFKQFLKEQKILDVNIEYIIINMVNMYKLGNSFINASFAMLEDYGLVITEDNMQETLNYLTDIYNNTRIWVNNGWTPIEMRKEYK